MRVVFLPGVLDGIRARCVGEDLETGGILVGTVSPDGELVRVVYAPPTPEDSERSPRGFRRGAAGVNAFIESVFPALLYLGEWHSHPCGPNHPSGTDMAAMFDLAKETESSPLLLIVGGCDGKDPALWLTSRNMMQMVPLGVPETLKSEPPVLEA